MSRCPDVCGGNLDLAGAYENGINGVMFSDVKLSEEK